MIKRITYRIFKASYRCGLLIIALLFAANMKAGAQELVVVGNTSGAPAVMKLSELKSVLMGEKQRWKDGSRIVIALMKTNTALGKTTSARIYDMSGDELNKYWLALVFQGKAQAPNFFNSVSDLQNFVAQNPGAIGIIDKQVTDAEIRSISIDGKKAF